MMKQNEINERMKEIEEQIKDKQEEIKNEIVPGSYFYDVDKVENLKKEIQKMQEEYKKLDETPTIKKVDADLKDLNEKLSLVEEELEEANGSYFLTDDMKELDEQRKELIETITDKEETKQNLVELEQIEKDLEDLEEEINDLSGAYFIPEDITKEKEEKENRKKELEEKLKSKKVNTKSKDIESINNLKGKNKEEKDQKEKSESTKGPEKPEEPKGPRNPIIEERPDYKLKISQEELAEDAEEYENRLQDMVDKYYGNKDKEKEYKERLARLESYKKQKEYEIKGKEGKNKIGIYQTIEPYEKLEEDLKFLQLEQFPQRLERMTKAENGDFSGYEGLENIEKQMQEDKQYIETRNNAYNRIKTTQKNLITLGKYGEVVPYSKMQKGQPIRNTLKAIGNTGKFLRNHITAPIYKFVGLKIVAPIYGKVKGSERGNTSGIYANKRTHRYEARRDYFEDIGQGFFKSRFNAIFKAKEGNEAVLAAGAYDIEESIKQKRVEKNTEKMRKEQLKWFDEATIEKIATLENELNETTDRDRQEKIKNAINQLKDAKVNYKKEKTKINNTVKAQTVQTDAVDMDQHDKANKGNVTRTVTVIKGAARWGAIKYLGPKLKEWALERTKRTEGYIKRVPRTVTEKKEVPVYKNVPNHSKTSLQDITTKGDGTHYTGFKTVAGGEKMPQDYVLKSTDKITAAWQEAPGKGTGISDLSGLTAPVLTDKTAAAEFLDTAGVLKQNLTVEQIGKAINNGVIDPNTYVSINDHHWVKLSDIYKPMMEKVQTGTTIKEFTKTVYDLVKAKREVVDEKMVSLLEKLGGVANIAGKAIIADEVYENVRKTNSDVKPEKSQPRQYDYDGGVVFEYEDEDAKGIDALKLKPKTTEKGKTPEQVAAETVKEEQKKKEEKKQEKIDNDMEGR